MQDTAYLKQALVLASQRRGFCAPNPAVGAVVVKNHQIISTGEHLGPGHPHAEAVALQALTREDTQGASLYVTLEPCCHFGRTPPCTELIIQSGIKKVVYAFRDPDPKVNQQGEKLLQQAGIDCQQISLAEIDEFYESYAWWQKHHTPWVTAKLALSLDGKIAGKKGERMTLTGKSTQIFTHQWRKRSDAVLTTSRTILADNPALNIRLPHEEVIAKPVYIIDRQRQLLSTETVFKTATRVKIFQDNIDLTEILATIGKEGVHDIWIEAGGTLFSALIQQQYIHRAFIYIAPMTLGESALPGLKTEANLFEEINSIKWHFSDRDVIAEMRWDRIAHSANKVMNRG